MPKFINDFILFKLLISNVIKIGEYYLSEFFIFNESRSFSCHKQHNLIKAIYQYILFNFSNTWIFVRWISYNWHISFPLFLYMLFNSCSDYAQMLIPTTEFVIPTGTVTNEINAETETQPVNVEAKISNCST